MQPSQPKTNGVSKLIGIYKLVLWNLLEPLLGTSEPLEPFRGTLSWNFETFRNLTLESLGILFWNLHLELLLGISEPLGTLEPPGSFTWNPYLDPGNLPGPLLGTVTGTLTWNIFEPWNLLDPLPGTFTWNPYLEPRNLAEPCSMTAPECPRP